VRSREIARRYAEALFRLGQEEGRLGEIEEGYRELLAEVEAVPDLVRFLEHPLVPVASKVETIDCAFQEIPSELRGLLHLLIRNRRTDHLGLVFEEFLAARAREEGVTRVGVVAARGLDAEERARLSERVTRALGRRVELDERVDPDLLGGVRIEIGDRVVDATLLAKLEGLKAHLER